MRCNLRLGAIPALALGVMLSSAPALSVEKWVDYRPPAPECGSATLEVAFGENGCVNLTGRIRTIVGYDSQSGAMPIFQGFARGTVVLDDNVGLALSIGGHLQRVSQPDWFYSNEAEFSEAFVSIGHENYVRAGYFDPLDTLLPRESDFRWLTEIHALGFEYARNVQSDSGLGVQGGFTLAPGFSIFGAAESLDRDRKQFIAGAKAESGVLSAKLTTALVDDRADPSKSGAIVKGVLTADFGAIGLQGGVSIDTTQKWSDTWTLYGAAKVQSGIVFATGFGTMSDYYTEVGGAVGLGIRGETPTLEVGGQHVHQWSDDMLYGWVVATIEPTENVSLKGRLVYADIAYIEPFLAGVVEAIWQATPNTQLAGAYEASTLGAIKATASVEQRF